MIEDIRLPVTWRPRRTRVVVYPLAVLVAAAAIGLAVAMPDQYLLADRVGFLIVGAAIVAGLWMLGRSRVRADPGGLTVVNLLRTTELEWAEVLDVTLAESWAVLDLGDGETMAAMGIQAADGAGARDAVAQLRTLIADHGEAPDR